MRTQVGGNEYRTSSAVTWVGLTAALKGRSLLCTCPPLAAVLAGVAEDVREVVTQAHGEEVGGRAIAIMARVDVAASRKVGSMVAQVYGSPPTGQETSAIVT